MIKVQKLNKISPLIFDILDSNYTVETDINNPDAILVRSASMHEYVVGDKLIAIARAGAGVNNIPLDKMSELGVAVFNTPGANANAVKELVITALLISNRDIVGGINWAKTLIGQQDAAKQIEAGKKAFVGPELYGKTIGIIGTGAIGLLVANTAINLGMKVIAYDPYVCEKIKDCLDKTAQLSEDINNLYKNSDYITLHVPLNDGTRSLINAGTLGKMKDGVKIINAARGELVDNAAMLDALNSGKVSKYITDFPNADVIGKHDNIIAIPHLGASTPEAEDNCAIMAANELKDFIENGNTINSVNYPNLSADKTGNFRVTVLSKENILQDVIATLAKYTIKGSLSGTRKGFDYYIIDIDAEPTQADIETLSAKTLKVRLL